MLFESLPVPTYLVHQDQGNWFACTPVVSGVMSKDDGLAEHWTQARKLGAGQLMVFRSSADIDLLLASAEPHLEPVRGYVDVMRRLDTHTVVTIDELNSLLTEHVENWNPALAVHDAGSVLWGRFDLKPTGSAPVPFLFETLILRYLSSACVECLRTGGPHAFRYVRFLSEYRTFLRVAHGEADLCEPHLVLRDGVRFPRFSAYEGCVLEMQGEVQCGLFARVQLMFRRGKSVDGARLWLQPPVPRSGCECTPEVGRAQGIERLLPLDVVASAAGGAS